MKSRRAQHIRPLFGNSGAATHIKSQQELTKKDVQISREEKKSIVVPTVLAKHKLQINFYTAGDRELLYSIPDEAPDRYAARAHTLFPVPRVGEHVTIQDQVSGDNYDFGLVTEVIWRYIRRDPAMDVNVRAGNCPADTIHADVILVPASESF